MRPGPIVLNGSRARPEVFDRAFPAAWYDRPTPRVARELLGALLIHRTGAGFRLARIVETEAYVSGDRASHVWIGPTMRNRAMFGPPGTLYVFRLHQVHLANAVTHPGEAVLLRAAEPGPGVVGDPSGPGRLCRCLGIELQDNGGSLVDGPVRIAPGPAPSERIRRTRRIGVRQDAHRPLRFALEGNPWLSRPVRPQVRS